MIIRYYEVISVFAQVNYSNIVQSLFFQLTTFLCNCAFLPAIIILFPATGLTCSLNCCTWYKINEILCPKSPKI